MGLISRSNKFIKAINPDSILRAEACKPEHVVQIKLRKEQEGSIPLSRYTLADLVSNPALESAALFIGDELVFVGGVVPKWGDVGEGWLLVDEKLPRLSKSCLKEFFMVVNYYAGLFIYERIETSVLEGFTSGMKFVEGMGFKNEGIREKYGADGKNYWGYSLVKE